MDPFLGGWVSSVLVGLREPLPIGGGSGSLSCGS